MSSPDNSLLFGRHALALLTSGPAKETGDQQGLQHQPSATSMDLLPAQVDSHSPRVVSSRVRL